MHPHLAGDMSEYYMAIFQLYPEGGIGEVFKDLTLHLNNVVFRHDPGSLAKRHVIAALEIRLTEQRLILLRHHIRLHLRHEVHRHHHDNQQ